jgi:hypothetical protein
MPTDADLAALRDSLARLEARVATLEQQVVLLTALTRPGDPDPDDDPAA